MSVFLRPDCGDAYHYEFQLGGQRFRGSTGCTEKRAAERWEAAEKTRIKLAQADQKAVPSMPFDAAADRYWDEVGRHSKEHDLAANLERLVLWIGQRTPLLDINNDMLARLVARRRADVKLNSKGGVVKDAEGRSVLVSVATVNRSVTELLRRIMTIARRKWEIPLRDLDWKGSRLKEPEERVRELEFDEEDALFAALRPDYHPIVKFAIAVGLRRRPTVDLSWTQVNWSTKQIRVKGKGDKFQTIPITDEIRGILWPLYQVWKQGSKVDTSVFTYTAERTRVCATSGKEFVRGQRYPITYQGYATEFTRACKAAGVVDFKLHDQRHTAATRTLRGSKNPAIVQRLLNHSDIKTTMKYAHIKLDDLIEGLNATAADVANRRAESAAGNEVAVAETPHAGPHAVKRMRTKGRKKQGN